MQIIYAPSLREIKDIMITNSTLGYDIALCECLDSAGGGANIEILFLPFCDTKEDYNKKFLDSIKHCNIKRISSLKEGIDSSFLVSDISNIVYAYSLFCKRPSILFLNGFDEAKFGNDKLDLLLNTCVYCAYSHKELRNIIQANMDRKIGFIEHFLASDIA